MAHSTVTKKGQTTIPGAIREALKIKAGDRLLYQVEGDRVMVCIHPGTTALGGVLASDKGRNLSLTEIRRAASVAANKRRKG